MVPNEIRTRTTVSRLDATGILHVTTLPGVEETLADAEETFRAGAQLRAGRRMPVLVDIRAVKFQSRDARLYYATPEVAQTFSAVALLVASHLSKLMANFFISLAKPTTPTRMFTDETEAREWLKGFMQ